MTSTYFDNDGTDTFPSAIIEQTAAPTPNISTPSGGSSPASSISSRSSQGKRMSLSKQQSVYTVPTNVIENMMKSASLDTLTGYALEKSMPVRQRETGSNLLDGVRTGFGVLREPVWNKGKHIC